MLKVGITGGIGSGKSTVCMIFSLLGIPVFEADKIARQLMDNHPVIREQLIDLFGEAVYMQDRTVDRKYLAEIAFNDPSLLTGLNGIVHPVVLHIFYDWCDKQQSPYVLLEAAILFESGFYKMMDKTIVVVAGEAERIRRVQMRDGVSPEMVKKRIKNQWNDQQRMELADFLIENEGSRLVIPQVLDTDKKIRAYG
jgi:dephospho-CoA kinase